jgi:DNA-binding CsgD family transcriptional regulator
MSKGAAAGDDPESLTPREREVLGQVARGHSYAEIGEALFISPKTVENHVRNILAKLHLSRRHELIRWAVDRGIS